MRYLHNKLDVLIGVYCNCLIVIEEEADTQSKVVEGDVPQDAVCEVS